MPKILQTMCEVMPEEAVLVRNAYLRNDIKASELLDEAKRRARKLTVRAEREAAQVYNDARTEGYTDGMLYAADAIVQYLVEHAVLVSRLQKSLNDRVADLLGRCVNNPDVVMATFEECLDSQKSGADMAMELLLPESFRSNHHDLLENVKQHFAGSVSIEYRDDSRFLIRLGDHVAEFSPDDFVMQATERVMRGLPSMYQESRALADACLERLATVFGFPVDDGQLAQRQSSSIAKET